MRVKIKDSQKKEYSSQYNIETWKASPIVAYKYAWRYAAITAKSRKPMWNTLGGKYHFKMATPRDIEFPELYTTKVVTWIAHVDETTGKTKAAYE